MNVSAEVPPNKYSSLAAQLEVKEDGLNYREHELSLLQQKIAKSGSLTGSATILGMFAAIVALFVLLAANFYLDRQRKKSILKNSKLLKFFTKKLI